jgi:hypothetical protein
MTSKQIAKSVADIIKDLRLTVRTPSNVGTPGELVWVDPNTLYIDHNSYQRDTNEKHAMSIGANYRYDRAKVISGYRCTVTGIIYVTDGQHSSVGAALAKIPLVPVYVFDLPQNMTVVDLIKLQSAQFVAINKNQKRIQKYDEYRNDLLQGASYAVGVDKLCKKYDIRLIPSNKPKGVRTLSHIVSIINSYTQIGENAVDMALAFIVKFWPTDHIEGPLLMALARFFSKLENAKRRKLPKSDYNEAILFSAITQYDRSQKKVEGMLLETATMHRIATYGEASAWRARALGVVYNEYVETSELGADKLINTRILV